MCQFNISFSITYLILKHIIKLHIIYMRTKIKRRYLLSYYFHTPLTKFQRSADFNQHPHKRWDKYRQVFRLIARWKSQHTYAFPVSQWLTLHHVCTTAKYGNGLVQDSHLIPFSVIWASACTYQHLYFDYLIQISYNTLTEICQYNLFSDICSLCSVICSLCSVTCSLCSVTCSLCSVIQIRLSIITTLT